MPQRLRKTYKGADLLRAFLRRFPLLVTYSQAALIVADFFCKKRAHYLLFCFKAVKSQNKRFYYLYVTLLALTFAFLKYELYTRSEKRFYLPFCLIKYANRFWNF